MDSLIKLTRFSSAGQVNTEELHSSKDQRIPPQRSLSFKTEKKRAQNWFRRQFSRNMSRDSEIEHVTAVAAAAYAIKSLQDSSEEPGRVSERFSISGENATSSLSADNRMPVPAAMDEKKTSPPTIKKRLTFAEDDEHLKSPDTITKSERTPDPSASSIKKTPTFVADERLNSPPADRTSTRAPSMKKTPTLSDELKNTTNGRKPAGEVQRTTTELGTAASKPDVPPPAPPTETRRKGSTRNGVNQTPADVWEKTELEKIKERHEKLNATILSWESKKKKKARSKLDKIELQSESEQKRIKALQKFRSDMEAIDQIAGGARAQAEERRKKKELKTKAKANTIRTTGKVPRTCFCC